MGVGYGDGDGSGSGSGYGDGYGYGSGSGYGYGSGSGYGYGYGDGYGSGCGYGDGSGYGDGDGSGYGYGSGCGYGDGSGYGYGYGSGYGDGDGDGDGYLNALLEPHKDAGIVPAFWRSRKDGSPSNGGTGNPRVLGQTEEIEGPLRICTYHALHGTTKLEEWKGARVWIVGLHEPVQREGSKIASLKRTILADLGIWFND